MSQRFDILFFKSKRLMPLGFINWLEDYLLSEISQLKQQFRDSVRFKISYNNQRQHVYVHFLEIFTK